MHGFWQLIVHLYAYLSALPILTFAAIWFICLFIVGDKKKAFGLTVDITTFFLIGSVSAMYDQLIHTGLNGVWLIILLLLLSGGFLGGMQNRKYGTIDGKKIFRSIWRISFLVLSFFYVLFSIILIIRHILAA